MTGLDWLAFVVMPMVAVAVAGVGVAVFQRWMRLHQRDDDLRRPE